MSFNTFTKHFAKTSFVHPNVAYILLTEEKTGTTSGDFNSGAWRTRAINTVKVDQTGLVSLSNSQFTLPAGTYRIAAAAPAGRVDAHAARLFSITDSLVFYEGSEARASDSESLYTKSWIIGDFTITRSTVFELQHQCESSFAALGFGPSNSSVDPDILAFVELFKTA